MLRDVCHKQSSAKNKGEERVNGRENTVLHFFCVPGSHHLIEDRKVQAKPILHLK